MPTLFKKLSLGLLVFTCLLSLGTFQARAEDTDGLSDEQMQEKIAKWKKLKEENPEEFRRLIQARKQHLKQRLQELKEKDPQKFEQVRQKMFERRKERLRHLKREDPEKYRQVMQHRWQKLDEFKEKNPERFQQFMKKHPQVAERLEKREQRRDMKGKNGRGPNFGKNRN